MTLKFRALLAALALLFAGLAFAPPASAGNNYWSSTACYSGHPIYGMWFGNPGEGVWFRTSPYSGYPWIAGGVKGRIYQVHRAYGAECGVGFPTSEVVPFADGTYQFFRIPGSCWANYIIAWNNGQTTLDTIRGYC